jgi:hypothetical protein
MKLRVILLTVVFLVASLVAQSQTAQIPSTSAQVPRLVKVSGALNDGTGKTLTGIVGVTFSLYRDQEGGAALWLETQNVRVDGNGRYSVSLGGSEPEGLPADLFAAGQARWLGVQASGQSEQPRILLLSVPYALKAADADTLGGLPASAFLLAAPARMSSGTLSGPEGNPEVTAAGTNVPQASVTGSGTTNHVPLWTSSSTIGDSVLFQLGSGATAKVGIGTTTPGATLDVKGGANIGGTLLLPAVGTATASSGKKSQAHDMVASSFSSSAVAAVAQDFRWQAEPFANNTATPSGTLNLLFGVGGAAPAETGLKLSSKGIFTFAAGQKFPGTGTITGVTAGSGLAGGGSTGNVTLSLLTSCSAGQILQWNGTKWACSSVGSGTITGVLAGTDLTGGGTAGTVTLNLDTTKVPRLAAANTFTANQLIVGGGSGFALRVSPPDAATGSGLAGTPALQSVGSSADPNGLAVGGVGVTAFGGTGGSANVSGKGGDAIDAFAGSGQGGNGGIGISASGGSSNAANGGDGVVANGGGSALFYGGDGVFATGGPGGTGNNFSSTSGNGVVGVGGPGGFQEADGSGAIFTGGSASFGGFGIEVFAGSDSAAFFSGDIIVTGAISAGTKDFKIDHPLDPANKYLIHASVESSEMINIYTGNVTTDGQGEAQIQLPDWFEAVNSDFRYQLTVIGQFAQAIVSSKVGNHRFAIKTDRPNVEVSWQITGVRQDAFAKAHPLVVEQEKNQRERGFYLHPELYGAAAEKGISWNHHPAAMKRMKALREQKRAPATPRRMVSNTASAH